MTKWLCLLATIGCSPATYTVVSSFDEVILVTRDKEKARETAEMLTREGRVLASKPRYSVKKQPANDKMQNTLGSLIDALPANANKTGEPTAIAIPGWNHDLIEEKLRSRGVVFKNTQESGSEIAHGRNKEGRWVIKTQRLSPIPHSTVLFEPKSHPKWQEHKGEKK